MNNFNITKKDTIPLLLLLAGIALIITGIILKSLLVVAGFAGLLLAWLLSIDHLIANQRMHLAKRVVYACIIVSLPVMFAFYMGS